MLANIVLIVGGYLFGSLPFTAALARVSGLDLSQEKDLHIVLWHKVSKAVVSPAAFLDLAKGSVLGLRVKTYACCAIISVWERKQE